MGGYICKTFECVYRNTDKIGILHRKNDNDDNYLFITPHGKFNGHDVDKVIFVQNIKARETMEVVLVAEGLSETDTENVKKIYY